jgi:uncharacterized membrane protein YecN with MAPEG domain
MNYPTLTSIYAGLLGLVFLALSAWVVMARTKGGVLIGTGADSDLERRVRSHANFAEYVPFVIVLVGLVEAAGGRPFVIHAMLLPLLLARVAHPFGMTAPANSVRQFACRGGAMLVTWLVLLVASVLLVLRAL